MQEHLVIKNDNQLSRLRRKKYSKIIIELRHQNNETNAYNYSCRAGQIKSYKTGKHEIRQCYKISDRSKESKLKMFLF